MIDYAHQIKRAVILKQTGVTLDQFYEEFKSVIGSDSVSRMQKFARKYGIKVQPDERMSYAERLTLSIIGFSMAMFCDSKEQFMQAVEEVFSEGDTHDNTL